MLQNKHPPDYRYAKVRELEDRLARQAQLNTEEAKHSVISHWHVRSDTKVKGVVIQKRFEELMALREAKLNERRQRLADKLHAEDLAYKQELVSSRETPQERRDKLAAKARELAAKREAERADIAQRLRERAFMENCDVLRETNSKRILYRTIDERNAQIEQKMALKIQEEEEQRMYHAMNEQERLKMEQRHLDDRRRERERREATLKVLDEQVRFVEQRRRDDAASRQHEIAELKMLWDKVAKEQEEADEAERDKMRRLAAELQEFNRLKQAEMTEKDRRERELDLRILQEALSREAADEAREATARERRREDVRRYRQQLELMMAKDAEESAERDALIQAQADAQRARYDEELRRREAARQRLMDEVDAIRQEQIRWKQEQRLRGLVEVYEERRTIEAAQEAEAAERETRNMEAARNALTRRLEVQTQMVAKAHIRAAEEDEKLRTMELAQHAETQYMSQVSDALAKTDPPQWYGRQRSNWYD